TRLRESLEDSSQLGTIDGGVSVAPTVGVAIPSAQPGDRPGFMIGAGVNSDAGVVGWSSLKRSDWPIPGADGGWQYQAQSRYANSGVFHAPGQQFVAGDGAVHLDL